MGSEENFREKSYEQHSSQFNVYRPGGTKEEHAKKWFLKDTVDFYRHARMYQSLDPILTSEPKAKWVTVGDGRFGKDAKYILDHGCDALPTDISSDLLQEGVKTGYIPDYRQENAEALSFQDNQFNYAFCKESYHHFPRPLLALYEMLRVASDGVVLVEPNDPYSYNRAGEIIFRKIRNALKTVLGKKNQKHFYESTGNYVYSISRREIEKVALGLNYRAVAFKGINDVFFPGVEDEKIAANGPLKRKLNLVIFLSDLLCKVGLMDYNMLAVMIFKREPSQTLIQKLRDSGFQISILPNNPYITGSSG